MKALFRTLKKKPNRKPHSYVCAFGACTSPVWQANKTPLTPFRRAAPYD
jgi:hypothetical protein